MLYKNMNGLFVSFYFEMSTISSLFYLIIYLGFNQVNGSILEMRRFKKYIINIVITLLTGYVFI